MVILVSGERVHHIDRSRFYPDVRSPNAHQRGLFVSNEVGERQKALVEFSPQSGGSTVGQSGREGRGGVMYVSTLLHRSDAGFALARMSTNNAECDRRTRVQVLIPVLFLLLSVIILTD